MLSLIHEFLVVRTSFIVRDNSSVRNTVGITRDGRISRTPDRTLPADYDFISAKMTRLQALRWPPTGC